MKLVKRISLFMTMSMIMFGLGGFSALKAEDYFYPNRYRHEAAQTPSVPRTPSVSAKTPSAPAKAPSVSEKLPQTISGTETAGSLEEEQVIETAVASEPVVTADTLYLVAHVDLTQGTVTETEETVPVMYIGLNREELLAALSSYGKNPPLTELEQGFETIELTAFSKDRVAVSKYYKEKGPEGFYLMVADHFIVVCEEDRSTLYMNTDILLERLPDSLQREIMAGKHVSGEEELYLFLESYSS